MLDPLNEKFLIKKVRIGAALELFRRSIKVAFQCKRYKGTVSRAEVGEFRNAMLGRAEKGIFITTGSFSNEASKEAVRDGAPPIELVDGEKLVEMFEKAGIGVRPKTIYEVDHGFFEQIVGAT